MHADKISCTSIVTVSNDKQYTTLKYDLIITTSLYCMYPYSFKIHKKLSSNFQIRDEIQEKNPAHISLHKFTSAQSGLIPLNTFKSIIHLQTNTSVFLTTIQGLGNLN